MHKVSLIISAYRQARELARTLPRFIAQRYNDPIEYLICDDGSGLGTLACIRKWQGEANIRYLWQPDMGFRLARSRNNGLRCATGDIIVCVDADLLVGHDFVAKHVAAHQAFPSLVCGGRKRVFVRELDGLPIDSTLDNILEHPGLISCQRSDDWFQMKYARTPTPWIACIGANFSFVRCQSPVFFDEKFEGWGCEDQEFACRLWKRHGYSVIVETAITGIQLERGSPKTFTNMRPKTQNQIARYLRNLVHFIDSWPDIDTSPLCRGLAFYAYDRSRNKWTHANRPRFDQAYIMGLLNSAREWLAEHPNP